MEGEQEKKGEGRGVKRRGIERAADKLVALVTS